MDPQTPVRSFMDDPNIQWRKGKPNYAVVNAKYLKEKQNDHAPGSLEKIVEDICKTWEMEAMHKVNPEEWQTVDLPNFKCFMNEDPSPSYAEDLVREGSYNCLLKSSVLYDETLEDIDTSGDRFRDAFPGGFAWEVIEVFSGPPRVTFSWRHWAKWEGPYGDIQPTGENIEMCGMAVSQVTDDLKLQDVHLYFDPNPLLAKLLRVDGKLVNGRCPFSVANGPNNNDNKLITYCGGD